jgi:hypothetical protein
MRQDVKQSILDWAQAQLDTMPRSEYGGDWWGAYDDEWDINIWDADQYGCAHYGEPLRVTAYPIDYPQSEFVTIGFIREPAEWHYDESCNECGEPMTGKGDGSRPTRYADGYAHGWCIDDAGRHNKRVSPVRALCRAVVAYFEAARGKNGGLS